MPNARLWTSQHSLFAGLKTVPPDSLLSLIAAFAQDPRPAKIDLGVGVYRDEAGGTPVFRAVKEAEKLLLEHQETKAYLGPEGDPVFVDALKPWVVGDDLAKSNRLAGIQTPGGTGALRLAAELVKTASPMARVWMGLPTWPNHAPIFTAAGLAVEAYRQFDVPSQTLLFEQMLATLKTAKPGDVVLLQACGTNPTGADLDLSQWTDLAGVMTLYGLVPLIDFAYHGLGLGIGPDRAGVEIVLRHVGEALVAYSCDKNFGLYRERTGALFVFGQNAEGANAAISNLLGLARANWSMPPDHGAAIVRTILDSPTLMASWKSEVDEMQRRIMGLRHDLARTVPALASARHQRGMFALLSLDESAIARLRIEHGIYMAGSGRINIAGLNEADVVRFAAALQALGVGQHLC